MLSHRSLWLMSLLAIGFLTGGTTWLPAQEGPPGITTPTVFAPFDPHTPPCSAPAGLERVLAFAQDNEREFIEGVNHGLAMAAKDRGLGYRVALADNDGPKMIEQVGLFREAKVGGLVVSPVIRLH